MFRFHQLRLKHLDSRQVIEKVLAKPVHVSFWEEIIATLRVIVLQALPVGEVVGGEGETCRSSEGFPVHSDCTTEAWHYGGSRQRQNCLVVSWGADNGAYVVTHGKNRVRRKMEEMREEEG